MHSVVNDDDCICLCEQWRGYGQAMFVLFYVMLPAGVIGTIWSLLLLLQGLYLGGDARLIGAIPFALYVGSIALVFMGILE